MESKSLNSFPIIKVCISISICILLFLYIQVLSHQHPLEPESPKVISSDQINTLNKRLNVGDWIVRAGTGYESQLIQRLSSSPYSHIGLVIQTQPHVQIIHATTDDHPKHLNQVIVSTLEEFTQPNVAKSWAIYRLNTLTLEQRNLIAISVLNQKGKPFILGLKTEPHRYCTTIIADVLPDFMRSKLHWTKVEIPGLKGEILFPNALLQLDGIEKVYDSTTNYKPRED